MFYNSILYACTLGDAVDRLIAAVLRLASIDYIKVRRKYLKGLSTEYEMKKEREIYIKCVENWTPTYDIINPEYMLTKCNEIAESNINVNRMSTVLVEE